MPEDFGLVLDFLVRGKSDSFKSEPVAQLVGTNEFTLLEVVPKEGIALKIGEKIYVGKEERDKIDHIKKRVSYKELTSNAVAELPKQVEAIVLEQKEKFLGFYNNARPITIKRHQIELLPGMGKKHLINFLKEREKGKFSSFEEIAERVKLLPNPVNSIVKRVIEELEGFNEKHYLFARPPVSGAMQKPFSSRQQEEF